MHKSVRVSAAPDLGSLMLRFSVAFALLVWGCFAGRLWAHESSNLDHGCNIAAGEACYHTVLDDYHTPSSPHPNAIGEAFFRLNRERTQLEYTLVIEGLDLEPVAANRTDADDVLGIHLHLHVPDTVGPHVLNIFGLATYGVPAEEDADLVVDYEDETLSGIYDISDATIDPATGQPYFQFFPLTSKVIDDWLDELDAGDLMIAVHSVASGFPNMAIHGHIDRVPEPATGVSLFAGLSLACAAARGRRI
jgi:CHRD domain